MEIKLQRKSSGEPRDTETVMRGSEGGCWKSTFLTRKQLAGCLPYVIILTKTKRQYIRAKKAIKQILASLKLQVSQKKTKMGLLTKGFHFLGVEFKYSGASAPESGSETQIQPCQTQGLHARSCKRALARVQLMNENAVHPEKIQSYLVRWAAWWSQAASLFRSHCLSRLVEVVQTKDPPLTWLATGLTRL